MGFMVWCHCNAHFGGFIGISCNSLLGFCKVSEKTTHTQSHVPEVAHEQQPAPELPHISMQRIHQHILMRVLVAPPMLPNNATDIGLRFKRHWVMIHCIVISYCKCRRKIVFPKRNQICFKMNTYFTLCYPLFRFFLYSYVPLLIMFFATI